VRSFVVVLLASLGAACAAACGSASPPPSNAPSPAATVNAGPNRGPATLAFEGDPNGLYWDDATQALFIADSANNRITRWTDASGFSKAAELPAAGPKGPGLGQLARMPDGSFVVARFGMGTAGDVAIVKADGSSSAIANLDKTRRRIGIAVAPDGTVFDTYFVKNGSAEVGAVAKVAMDGTETDVIPNLQKPVGVAVVGDSLYVSDQAQGTLFTSTLAAPSQTRAFATLPKPDAICAGAAGALFVGGADGSVRVVSSSGAVSVLATGFQSVRGVAFDKKNGRVFIADHGAHAAIQIRPVQ
jgi:sugar lactone lactonase YvrE